VVVVVVVGLVPFASGGPRDQPASLTVSILLSD
jgi:hypothetical protein